MTARRWKKSSEAGHGIRPLSPTHAAILENRTLFPGQVRVPSAADLIFKSGQWSCKLGAETRKGTDGVTVPIYTVTHEERKTCPGGRGECNLYCMGDQEPWAIRWAIGPEFYKFAQRHLDLLDVLHPYGYIIRLQNLGDILEIEKDGGEHVEFWSAQMERHTPMRVWLYTANDPASATGKRLTEIMERVGWRRFNLRFSNRWGEGCAHVIDGVKKPDWVGPEMIVCPALVPKPGGAAGEHLTESCATCMICANSRIGILLPKHRKDSPLCGGEKE